MTLDNWLDGRLVQRHREQRYRYRGVFTPGSGQLDFAGNDYLGFSHHPQVIRAAADAAQRYGTGAMASPLVTGHGIIQQRLEERLAAWLKRERAVLFPSGFQANLAVLDALSERGDYCLHDRLNHASLLDGNRLSGARLLRYRHRDMDDLRKRLDSVPAGQRRLVISDGVFSMEGDAAPLDALVAISRAYQAPLIVDDAHGVGVCGREGAGLCADHDSQDIEVVMGTFSKALGSQGAFVAGSHTLIEGLLQFARPYIYSTGLSPVLAAAADQAVALCISDPSHRQRLHHNIAYWQQQAALAGLAPLPSESPIQGIVLSSEALTLQVAEQLAQAGIRVGAMRPPTVPAGSCRLRITLSAQHTTTDIDTLVTTIRRCISTPLSAATESSA